MSSEPFRCEIGRASVRLYREDCVKGLAEHIQAASVQVIVTSPPYNLGVHYGRYDDSISRAEYLDWTERWVAAAATALAPQGSLFVNVGSKPTDPVVPFEVLERLQRHLTLQNVIHWIKSIAIEKSDSGDYPGLSGDVAVGHYKPINSRRFVNDCHEYIFHLTHDGAVPLDKLAIGVPYRDKSNVTRWKSGRADRRDRGNTWFIPYETIRSRDDQRPHPATFPVKLAEMCIKLHGAKRAHLVLDPFLGLGPSALAAAHLGIDFVGFEIDPDYFAEACRRIAAVRRK